MKPAHLLLKKLAILLAVCALGFAPLAALAVTGTWIDPDGGSWTNAVNWSGGTIPGNVGDTADFSTLTLGSAPVVTLDGATNIGYLVFGDVGNTYGWTLATGSGGPLTLAVSTGSPTITVNNQTNTISLALVGTQGLTTAGSGTLLLTGSNTYTGNTLISQGTLTLGVGGKLTSSQSITIAANATLTLNGTTPTSNRDQLQSSNSTTSALVINGTLESTATVESRLYAAAITMNNGTISCNGGEGPYGSFAVDSVAGNRTITANGASNTINGSGNGIGINTPSVLTFNTPTAADAIAVSARLGATTFIAGGIAKSGAGTVTLSATNTYTGATTVSGGTLTIGGAGELGSGAYAGLITNNGTLNYSSTALQTLSGVIRGTGSLANNGPGTLTLSAVNAYSGPTVLNGGTTVGVTGGACAFSSVDVATTAAVLSVTITNNTETWSCTNLSFDAGGTLNFNFGAITPSSTVAPLVVGNAVVFTATPIIAVQGTAIGTLPIGSYPLITWGSVAGTVPTTVALPAHRGTANLSVNGNTLYLNITSLGTEPLYWAASSGAWDIGLSSNWKDSAHNITTYSNPDSVVFEDSLSGAGPITVTLETNVAPTSVTISNNLKSYTLAGTGAITGAQGLTKAGTNILVILNTNTYTGSTTIIAGTLQLGDGVADNGVVAGGIAVSNGATIDFAAATNQTYAGVISGSGGAVVISGAGTLTLTASNTYAGNTTINAGTLQLLKPGSISHSGTTTVNTNSELELNSNGATWAANLANTNISLNGGTLALTANSGIGQYITGAGVNNVPTASSFITVHAGSTGAPNATGLFLDNGLIGSGTITVSSDTDGIAVVLRENTTRFSGTIIVDGNPTTGSLASGLAVGNASGQPILTNTDLEIDGTMEMGNSYMGWANGTVNGLTLPIGALNGAGMVIANMGTAGFTRGLNIGGNGHDGIFTGTIVDGNNDMLSLIKTGNGTQTLTGANGYSGTTTVSGGTLLVGNPGSLASSPVSVQSGGTLGGDGSLSGPVTVQGGGTLTVGTNSNSAVDTLAIYNTLTFAAGSTNVMRISKDGGVAANDQVTGLNSVTYGGTLVLVNITSDNNTLALGDTFTLYPSAGAYSAGFGNVIVPALPAGLSWNLDNLTVDGSISIDNQVSTPLFSPGGGGYAGAQSVTISCATVGATIYYTTDGSTPTTNSSVYSGPITVPVPTASMTIQAFAAETGVLGSTVASATYSTVVTPTWVNPNGGSWSDTSSWSNAVVANGVGITADFSTLTLPSDAYVTLNIPANVGALVFADQGNAFNWNLTDGGVGPLTLDSGTNKPVITVVNTNTTISAGLAGTNGFIKAGAGTLTLSGPNTYTGSTTVNATVGGITFTTAPSFTTFTGNGTVELNLGTAVGLAGTFGSGFRGQINITGAGTALSTGNSMSSNLGDVDIETNASLNITSSTVQADELTGPGSVTTTALVNPVFATLTLGANNGNGGNALFSGPITSGNNDWISIVKNGTGAQELSGNLATGSGTVTVNAGTLTLSGTNTYTGTTVSNGTLMVNGSLAAGGAVTVAGGTLAGGGTIGSPVTVQAGGTISPGTNTNSIGTLTINSNLTLLGNLLMKVDKTQSPSSDVVAVTGAITNLGTATVIVTNLNNGVPLAVGDTFYPFGGQTVVGGEAMVITPVPGTGLAWQNHLAVDGSIAVVSSVATNPTDLTCTVSGGTLHLSWPANYLGWHLQEQTNLLSIGLSTNWVTIPGSDTITSTNIPINPAIPTVFYRMVYP